MPRSPLEYLRHMRDEAEYLASQAGGLDKGRFLRDGTAQRAFVRSLEVLGEAAKRVPPDLRERYPGIDWKAICGMRDRLIHDYLGVDYEIVWDAAERKAPELKLELDRIMEKEERAQQP